MKNLHEKLERFQKEKGWEISTENSGDSRESLLLNHMLLTTEIAEIAEELRKMMNYEYEMIEKGLDKEEAFLFAKREVSEEIGKEIADCIAYLCKFATFFERDIEEDILNKLQEINNRTKTNLQKRMKEEVK
ncbi:hypothetical protein [Bacillus sp. NEB1478]|uniref:hypothetical protein n=1 Tax=Bacillus sp. NEB1478 TaxID=3073816 RepID=UPI0028736AEC|nr:hypothetical protein [Bacillus sp. NEB1478]WNB90805.1 hypothetical protein RGB74_12875 [Bacillus sp. NEB1478]